MRKLNQFKKLKNNLNQSLNVASQINDKKALEIKSIIKKAINKTNSAIEDCKDKKTKLATAHEKWWENIRSGLTKIQLMNQQQMQNAIKNLDQMIEDVKNPDSNDK